MFRSIRERVRAVAVLGLVVALGVAGVAAAQGSSNNTHQGQADPMHAGRHGGPPPLGPGMKGLTYAQFHVQTKEGKSQVIRLDEGKITAVDSTSITLEENDGSEVTVSLSNETVVRGKPGTESSVEDLKVGQRVTVCGPEGEAAKTVMVMPKKGERHAGRAGRQGPPPGGPGQHGPRGQGGSRSGS